MGERKSNGLEHMNEGAAEAAGMAGSFKSEFDAAVGMAGYSRSEVDDAAPV